MTVEELQKILSQANPKAVVCVYDLFQYPPHNFYRVQVAEEVGTQPFTINTGEKAEEAFGEDEVFMIH